MKNSEEKVKSFDGTELFCVRNLVDNPKAVLVIVHGLCEHLGRYEYLTEKLNGFSYSVYRFDNRGHGKSGGERGYIEDFQYFFDDADIIVDLAMAENKGVPVFMLGHSMGGFITAGYGIKYRNKLRGQILSGAAVIELHLAEGGKKDNFFEKKPRAILPNSLSSLICRDKSVVKAYDDDPLVLKEFTAKLMGEFGVRGAAYISKNIDKYEYPCLILHGGNDQIVTNECAKWMLANAKSADKEMKIYTDCYHEILNEKDEKDTVIEDIHNWIEKRI
ncbi:MAG: alpha/beta hydrolase [Bacillota bacterium]|nr:alpha/beta hydrolase [Bacillota bacterium]